MRLRALVRAGVSLFSTIRSVSDGEVASGLAIHLAHASRYDSNTRIVGCCNAAGAKKRPAKQGASRGVE